MIGHSKKTVIILTLTLVTLLALGGCNTSGSDWGVMTLSITDAPLMADDVQGVYVTITDVRYNSGGGWSSMEGFDGTEPFDLLALNSGNSKLLGQLALPAGQYSQIRFILGAPEENSPGAPSNPGSWVEKGSSNDGEYTDGEDELLYVPSGAQSGYKATAEERFAVPANGEVSITADFDLRRAVVETGGTYILKPVLRMIVDDQAGKIAGEANNDGGGTYVAYAYEAGSYDSSEASDSNPFPNAITSSAIEDDPEGYDYVLPFLAEGAYDIVVARYDANGTIDTSYATGVVQSGVIVTAGSKTEQEITL